MTAETYIFLSVDPLSDKYPSLSPYAYCAGNPVVLVDPDGRLIDDYVFNEKGDFVRIDRNDKPDRLIIENSKTGNKKAYHFADPVNDPKLIESGKINRVEFVSRSQIAKMLAGAGAFNDENRENKITYLKEASVKGGPLDFAYSVLPNVFEDVPAEPLFNTPPFLIIPEGDSYAHNYMNFGNFLWGAAGYSLGSDEYTLRFGAHINSKKNSSINGYKSQWDSVDDQLSITRGIMYAKINRFREIKLK